MAWADMHDKVRHPERDAEGRTVPRHPERSAAGAKSKDLHPFALVLLAALILAFTTVSAPAAHAATRTGSITIDTTVKADDGTRDLIGDAFSIAQVATATVDTAYTPAVIEFKTVGSFAPHGYDWASLDASGWRDAARDLADFAQTNELYEASFTIGKGNRLVGFDGLEPGLYLVSRTGIADANKDVASDPVLVSVPLLEDGDLTYDVTVEPKYEWERVPGEPGGGTDTEKPWNERVYHVLGMPMTGDGAVALVIIIAAAGLGVLIIARKLRSRREGPSGE